MEEVKKYDFNLYERGKQYNDLIRYSSVQCRGYNCSLNLYNSYRSKRY